MPQFRNSAVACRIAAVLAVTLILPACSGTTPPPLSLSDMATPQSYQLGSGDRIRVVVYNEPNLTNEFSVSSSGDIAFPLVGAIKADGQTAQGLSDAVAKALVDGGYQDNPKVSVEVLKYRPYYILGEVARPGQYEYAAGLTFEQAIAAAGGFTYRASEKRVIVRRGAMAPERTVELTAERPVEVMPGDTIRVVERRF
jgi:polysaccharide biosynthesis/export protein